MTGPRRVVVSSRTSGGALLPQGPEHDRDQRQHEVTGRCLRPGPKEVADLGQQPGALGLFHHQEMGVCRYGGQQGVGGSYGSPGTCEAQSFGYGLGSYTAALNSNGTPKWDPDEPQYQVSPAWLFAWAMAFSNGVVMKPAITSGSAP